MNVHLKIKIKSLAAEARIIRHEEVKARDVARRMAKRLSAPEGNPGSNRPVDTAVLLERINARRSVRDSLYRHRHDVVRVEARHSLLAYGYLREVPLKAIENIAKTEPNWDSVKKMIERFGGKSDGLENWKKRD